MEYILFGLLTTDIILRVADITKDAIEAYQYKKISEKVRESVNEQISNGATEFVCPQCGSAMIKFSDKSND